MLVTNIIASLNVFSISFFPKKHAMIMVNTKPKTHQLRYPEEMVLGSHF